MKKTKKIDARKVILPHSQAKLDFYKDYLKRYIPILQLADFTTSINIFDVFCGTGIYEDGKKGSPILAFDAIKESYENTLKLNKPLTPINLFINDLEKGKVEQVKQYLESQSKGVCKLDFQNKDAIEFLTDIYCKINSQTTKDRNLILIDPYGYKNIKKELIENLVQNKRNTEVILFLPISQIYRFANCVLDEEEKNNVQALKDFIESFFPDKEHPIYKNKLSEEKDLIEYIRIALTFNDKFYATSYYIQRDNKNHYYALFFLTPNIYGLEKILEVKWLLNDEHGEGFEQPKQPSLFDEVDKENNKLEQYEKLEKLILNFITEKDAVNNIELYLFTLKNNFLKKHSNEVLRNLQNEKKINVTDLNKRDLARKGSFYLGYEYYKKCDKKIIITLK
ncbi:MAG: hypothetical protein A2033_15030 [Bacteroidetes bacterium GWA2_31_9]|nr:MAG: hypothetical protein A2033_15030 [Bacteroidetes bacterium GWA2_31_9]